ncbi:MAG: type VI secretion system Vgr family protein [Geminicoccaceae bacterium]
MAPNRDVVVKTELGDAFTFRHMRGREAISDVFDFELELLSEDDGIALEDMLGKPINLTMQLENQSERYFHGYAAEFVYGGTDGSYARYFARVRPWLWFLSNTTDCRIFQNMSVPDIVKQIFSKYPNASYEFKVNQSYSPRVYCVQYDESDLDFVRRLLEEEGIFFFFEHQDGEHKLLLGDDETVYLQRDDYHEVPFFPRDDQARRERDHLYDWQGMLSVRPGSFVQNSFDFEKPKSDLLTRRSAPLPHDQAEGEVYCYPACYEETDQGTKRARIRLEEYQASHKRMRGAGTVAGLGHGQKFKLTDYPRSDQNDEYLVIAIDHEIWADAYRASASSGDEDPYLCAVDVQPASIPYRSPMVTPRPVVTGPQTAIVTGPSGEEIWTDKYGRVKVQFPWDREGKKDENSSRWIRVSQAWAGTGFGGIHIPRIGQEVIIEFWAGNPDWPMVTGRVYDAANMPPYGLPGSATQSGIKSDSTKGGGGSNELRFEDKKGEEQVWIHAQKNEDIKVENDKTENVGHDETIGIAHDRTEEVGNNETLTVVVDRTRNVGKNEQVTVGSNQTVNVGQNRTDMVGANETRTVAMILAQNVGLHRNVAVGGNQTEEVALNAILGVGQNRDTSVGQNDDLSVAKTRSTSIGDDDSLNVGKTITINAGDEITIVTGKASINMKKDGTIRIAGKDITIDGSGKIDIKAKKNITQKGQKILQN